MRSAQGIILEIARALQEGDKNAQKLLLAISGGRYQYSKLYAILKDEEEILRMWAEAVNSAGFADKQLEVQMNTLNAKMKQLEANVSELGYAFMSSGTADLIKEGVDMISAAVKKLGENFGAVEAAGKTFLVIFGLQKLISIVGAFGTLSKKSRRFSQGIE